MSEGSDPQKIEFSATVYKVQTLATDQGIRVTLDLPETAIMQMAMLAECQRAGVYLQISATVVQADDRGNQHKSRKIHI